MIMTVFYEHYYNVRLLIIIPYHSALCAHLTLLKCVFIETDVA